MSDDVLAIRPRVEVAIAELEAALKAAQDAGVNVLPIISRIRELAQS